MQRRQITLEDGRYLIFYTFAEETAAVVASSNSTEVTTTTATGAEESPTRRAPQAEPQATEEPKRV